MFKSAVPFYSVLHKYQMNLRALQLSSPNPNWTLQCLKHLKCLLCGHLYNRGLSGRGARECVIGCKVTGCSGVTHGQLSYSVSPHPPETSSHDPVWHNLAHQIAKLATKILVVLGVNPSLLSSALLLVWPIVCWLQRAQLLLSVAQRFWLFFSFLTTFALFHKIEML